MNREPDSAEPSAGVNHDEESTAVQCKGCGTKFWGVNQKECDRWMAGHILDEHSEEAPDSVLEEARERLEEMKE